MNSTKIVPGLDWDTITRDLDEFRVASTGQMLDEEDCHALRGLYSDDRHFRSRIVMQRHGFGAGEYKYFANPLPSKIDALRHAFYEKLAPVGNDWNRRMGLDRRYPETLDGFLAQCHADNQSRPTPLLLKYGPGDYNCLHQDVYGSTCFRSNW